MSKKIKSEYMGQYVTVYLNGREVSFNISEETANDADFWTNNGLGHIFEEVVVKKIKTDANTPPTGE
jgi:hypothetical protein